MENIGCFAIYSNRGQFRDVQLTLNLNSDDHADEAVRVFTETVVDKRNDTNSMAARLLTVTAEGTDEYLFSIGSPLDSDDYSVKLYAYIRRPLFTNDIAKDKVDFVLLHTGKPTNIGDGNKINFDEIGRQLKSLNTASHSSSTLVKDFGTFPVASNGTSLTGRGAKKTFDISLKIEVAPEHTEIEDGVITYAHSYATASFNPRDWYEDDWTGLEHPYTDQGVLESINAHLRQLGYTKEVDWSEQGRQEFALLDFDASYELLGEIWPELKEPKTETAA